MIVATHDNCEETQVHRFCTDQHALGLGPQDWPDQIKTTLGNGQPFLLKRKEVYVAEYHQGNGCISLRVYHI